MNEVKFKALSEKDKKKVYAQVNKLISVPKSQDGMLRIYNDVVLKGDTTFAGRMMVEYIARTDIDYFDFKNFTKNEQLVDYLMNLHRDDISQELRDAYNRKISNFRDFLDSNIKNAFHIINFIELVDNGRSERSIIKTRLTPDELKPIAEKLMNAHIDNYLANNIEDGVKKIEEFSAKYSIHVNYDSLNEKVKSIIKDRLSRNARDFDENVMNVKNILKRIPELSIDVDKLLEEDISVYRGLAGYLAKSEDYNFDDGLINKLLAKKDDAKIKNSLIKLIKGYNPDLENNIDDDVIDSLYDDTSKILRIAKELNEAPDIEELLYSIEELRDTLECYEDISMKSKVKLRKLHRRLYEMADPKLQKYIQETSFKKRKEED